MKEIKFDGRTFRPFELGSLGLMTNTPMTLYLAKQARSGDSAARMVLEAFPIELMTVDGEVYWPADDELPGVLIPELVQVLHDEIGPVDPPKNPERNFGALFVRGIKELKDQWEFTEKHADKVDELYQDRSVAASVQIGDVYVEYRPNVGRFDGVLLLFEEVE
jgi:hypothetical protein